MIWKDVFDFPYEVSSTGLVRRKSTKRLRKLYVDNGYLRVTLSNKDSHQTIADKFGIKRSTAAGIRRRAKNRNQ